MARWRYDVKRLLLICFIFIANVGFGVLFTNDLVTEVFLKPELSKDVCASDLPPPVLSKTKTNTVENLDDEQVSPINVEEDEELKNEKNYMDTLKVVLQKVKNEVVEDNRRSSSHSEGRKSLHLPVEDGKSATAEETERPNKVVEENSSSKVKTKKVIRGKTKESVESSQSSSPNEYGKTLLTDPDPVLEEELILSEEKTSEILVETETSTKEENQKPSQDSDQGSGQGSTQQRQTGHEADEKTVGTTPQLDTLVQRPAPWTAPESPANLSDSTPTEQEVRPPVTPEEENITRLGHPDSAVNVDEKPSSSTQEPANETELLSQEAEELPPKEAELPESNVTAPPAAVAEEPKLPQEVAEDAQKDQLETYSQFAERVTAEKKNGASSTNGHTGNGQLVKGPKVKTKNYASTDCGAKFLAANPESSHSHKIINSNKDEYMLNKCTGKIWAIVELCESIRPQKFDIANFELFSNSPKDIYLLGSHRYPTREWISLGAYEGEEGNRDVQSFDVETQEFFKFIKLEVHSYYGTEFFCPLSQFKIYGLSEFEVIEDTEDVEEEDQIIEEEALDEPKVEDTKDKPGMIPNVIKSVVSGMLGVIKRGSRSGSTDEPELNTFTQSCRSLHANFSITDEMCPFAESLNYILACYYDEYLKLMEEPFVASVVQNAHFCHRLFTVVCATPKTNDSLVYDSVCNNSYACVMLSPKHVLAMCYMQDPSSLRDSVKCTSAQSEEVPPPAVPKNTSSQVGTFNMKGEKDPVHRQSSTETPPMPEQQPSTTSVKKKKTPESPPAAGPVPPPDPTKEEVELNVIHLPHIDSTKSGVPKEPIKKGKDSQSPVPESMPNVTVAPAPDKGTVQNVDKKERKGEKEPVEKVTINEDPPQSVGGQGGGLPSTATPPSATAESRVGSHSNKESVVVRLSNKIKVLETNMSISSQYLEELSRRYKRQMEDLQRQFNITILALNKTSQTAYERDLYHQKRLEALENQLEKLAQVVSILTEEKESLLTRVVEQHMILLFVELAVMFLVFSFCLRRRRREEEVPPSPKDVGSRMEIDARWREGPLIQAEGGRETPSFCRRRSVDSIRAAEGETKPRERRLSGHLAMTGSYKDLLIKDTTITKEKKKKKKRVHLLERSLSNASISEKSHHHSSAATKKEKKLEKLKRSSAGVLFSGEKGSKEELKTTYHHNGTAGKDINHEDWHMVRKSRSKTKRDETTSPYPEEPYVFSSDLKRGKIILDHDPVGYPHQYYAEIPFDHDPVYGRDFDIYNYSSEMESIPATTTTSESFADVYLPDLDYSGPVVSDYYSMGEETHQQSYRSRKRHSFKNGSQLEDVVDSSFMDVSKSPKVLAKARSCAEFRSPSGTTSSSTFKGRTKLRSDNWEWYSSQPSRLLSSCCSSVATTAVAEIVSTSSSDSSSVKSKPGLFSSCEAPRGGEAAHKLEKKKKKKVKGPKLTNGENR